MVYENVAQDFEHKKPVLFVRCMFLFYLESEVLIHKHLGEVRRCDCLPDCNDVLYAMSLNTVTSPKL